jgi:hypothetical protein
VKLGERFTWPVGAFFALDLVGAAIDRFRTGAFGGREHGPANRPGDADKPQRHRAPQDSSAHLSTVGDRACLR